MTKPFLLLECHGGLAPNDITRHDTLEEAIEAIGTPTNPDFDLIFVVELSEDGAETVYEHPYE